MKLQRYKIKLNEFDFDIKHIAGKENNVADALSRIKLKEANALDTVTMATCHSSKENENNGILITEKPLNTLKKPKKLLIKTIKTKEHEDVLQDKEGKSDVMELNENIKPNKQNCIIYYFIFLM